MSQYTTDLVQSQDVYQSYENSDEKMTWCGSCWNYGIQKALFSALALENIHQKDCLICYDVWCSGNESDKLWAYTIHGLHGRVLPLAAWAYMWDPSKKIIAHAWDGATLSEWINHLIHAIRSNYDITFIMHNNGIYGLTIWQASSATRKWMITTATPDGVLLDPVNALDLVMWLSPSFVARSVSTDFEHMTDVIRAGLNHKGFSFIEILQACPTFNKVTTDEWYSEHTRDVSELWNHDVSNLQQARALVQDMDDVLYTWVIYQNKNELPYLDKISHK